MFYALHPEKNVRVTVEQYHKFIGSRPIGGRNISRPRARCPLCANTMAVRANNPNRRPHFWHDIERCIAVPFGRNPYDGLAEVEARPTEARVLKAAFRAKWRNHFRQLGKLVPKLSVNEFTDLLDRAERHGIWNFVNLRPEQVPYVLVMLADYPPWTGLPTRPGHPGREFWYRFWFMDAPHDLRQVWMWDPPISKIVRGAFQPPAKEDQFPPTDDFEFEVLDLLADFLDATIGSLNPYIEERAIAKMNELQFPESDGE